MSGAQLSGRFSEEKAPRLGLRKRLSLHRSALVETPKSPAQKFFAELGAPMTERQRGLNRAAHLWFKKATAINLTCEIDIEQTWESFHAHAIPQNVDIHPGDIILVHDVPTDIEFGGTYTGTRCATLIRAGFFRRLITRMRGLFELTELFEVGFDPIDKKG